MNKNLRILFNLALVVLLSIAMVPFMSVAVAENPELVEIGGLVGSEVEAQVASGGKELYYDDGTAEIGSAWVTGGDYFAVSFSVSPPFEYPVKLVQVRALILYFFRQIELVVFDSDGVTVLWSKLIPPTDQFEDTWVEENLDLLLYRDFYVAVRYPTPWDEVNEIGPSYVGLDFDSPAGRSYWGPPMTPMPLDIYDGNWMIRAVIHQNPPVGGSLEENRSALSLNSTLPPTLLIVSVSIIAFYLLSTRKTWGAEPHRTLF